MSTGGGIGAAGFRWYFMPRIGPGLCQKYAFVYLGAYACNDDNVLACAYVRETSQALSSQVLFRPKAPKA